MEWNSLNSNALIATIVSPLVFSTYADDSVGHVG